VLESDLAISKQCYAINAWALSLSLLAGSRFLVVP